ncbi:MAG: hypothetical protein CHKLHMKO_00668 [Candidatus Argoarchaeum ethanivorans]|uniref:Uncharacterized protein n=1 Tax=Candidatus Argoarchaeum ethanivorans TaxID=2608793 RepID=A0A811TEP8_9EURY|nr:MAG: hypothetical protein CHKLHMKO_00668 [Candidatus Argoarchaeum ethanivorans]
MGKIVNEMQDERRESHESMKGLTDAILELARTRKQSLSAELGSMRKVIKHARYYNYS